MGLGDRLCAYARSVGHFPTALKEYSVSFSADCTSRWISNHSFLRHASLRCKLWGEKILLGICSRGILRRMFSCDRIFYWEYIHVCNAFKLFVNMSEFAALHWNKTFHNFYRIKWKHITVQWRNGWFADLSEAAKASNQPDPSPYHTAIMGPLYVKVTQKIRLLPLLLLLQVIPLN